MTTGPGHTAWPTWGLHQLPGLLAWRLCADTSGLGKLLLQCGAAVAIHLHQARSVLVEPVIKPCVNVKLVWLESRRCESKKQRHGQQQEVSLMSYI